MNKVYKTTGIYRITNKINGNSYIGKTAMNFGDRWDCHRAQLNGGYHDNRHLQAAWNKYGSDNFEFCVVEECDDPKELDKLERKYIALYRDEGHCYNISDGGDGGHLLGKHLSDETKKKIGAKNRINMLGKKASPETRQKMSQSQLRRYAQWTEDDHLAWQEKMRHIHADGYKWTDDSRQRFSQMQYTKPNGAKYTVDDIRSIREKRANGATLNELATEYNTSPSYISSIVHYRRWAHV